MRGEDRLSDLPEHILHHIFSSFTTKDLITTTCLLSKKWQHFWEVEIVLGLDGTMFTIPAKVFAKGSSVRVIKLEACFRIFTSKAFGT
ncbi:hypothetical protein Sjap_025955 [Stephania japonica]|uniref:F-box domain-containing protein n=1 Tax=Stephania japonica TaxID=461633 RepID=A0AAP0HG30_9MAGN